MAWRPISSIVPQYEDDNGAPASGFVLKAYSAGTSTTIAFATDSTGGTQAATIALNASGYPEVSGNIVIPHLEEKFKLSLYPTQAAADSNTGATWTVDNLFPVYNDDTVTGLTALTSPASNDEFGIYDVSASALLKILLKNLAKATNTFGIPVNLSLSPSVATNALTMAVKGSDGNDPSASNVVLVPFRSSTATEGTFNWREVTAALSLVISSGSTLGHNSALKQYIYWYLIDNAGTVELAASSKFFGNHGIVTTTAEGGAGAADSGTTMYSTAARTSVPFVCIGYTEDTQTTAGTWATAPSTIHLAPFSHPVVSFSAHKNGTDQTAVATGTKITFPTEIYDNGGLFDAVTNFRWVPPPGYVRLHGTYQISASEDTKQYVAEIHKNGSAFKSNRSQGAGTGSVGSDISIDDECNGTDYYEFFIVHNEVSDPTISGNSVLTHFMGSWSPGRS